MSRTLTSSTKGSNQTPDWSLGSSGTGEKLRFVTTISSSSADALGVPHWVIAFWNMEAGCIFTRFRERMPNISLLRTINRDRETSFRNDINFREDRDKDNYNNRREIHSLIRRMQAVPKTFPNFSSRFVNKTTCVCREQLMFVAFYYCAVVFS